MRYEHLRNRHRHSLRCDIFRYFPAIDHAVLKRDISRVKRCASTRELIRHIIDGSNAQEPVIVHLPGGDLFTPDERRRGLSIGNVASLLFGKVYLDPVDHLLKDRLRIPGYVHYVDDLAVFLDDGHSLHEVLAALSEGLAARRLLAHLRKTWIASTAAPATFLGFEVFANGRRRLPDENVARFGNRLRGLRDR